jgi:hypothetical protein
VWPYPTPGNRVLTANLTAPANNATFTPGSAVTITANVSEANSSITKVEFFQGTTSLGIDNTPPYSMVWRNVPAGNYAIKVVATDQARVSTTSSTVNIKVQPNNTTASQPGCTASGTILRELWTKVEGKTVSAIPVNASPNSRSQLTLFEAPANSGDLYGQRIRGYICPPSTGNYTFWIASDDEGELWLSQDDKPANRRRIAYIQDTHTQAREWNKYPSQQSASIYLQAGKRYYIEALHKERWGGDNLAVGWQLPNGTQERPIPGNRLSPFQSASGGRIEAVENAEAELQTLTEVIAYPNPFRDIVTLEWEEVYTEAFTIHVTDALGVVHFRQEYPADPYRTKLEVSLGGAGLPNGIYFLRVQSPKERKVIRLLKQ